MAATSRNSTISKLYIFLYNAVQCIGWSYIGVVMCFRYYELGNDGRADLYHHIEKPLKFFQTAAVLEVLHCALGLVRSNVVLTAFQVASRVFLTWGIAHSVPTIQSHICITMFVSAWTLTEIIRYSLYALNIIGLIPYALQWCRYTFFIILYPIGVTGELLAIYNSLPYVKQRKMYSFNMPNDLNFSFDYYYFLLVVMVSYIPIFLQLYCHMLGQRRKIIGRKVKAA